MSNQFYFELENQLLEEPLNDIEAFLNCTRYNDNDDVELLQNYLDKYPQNIDACDDQGRTAVHMAAANGHIKILEVLFKFNPRPDLPNNEGNTALHFAALNNRISVAKLLLCKGWKANAVNIFNYTPLRLIQGKGFEEMEIVLLSHDPSLAVGGDVLMSAETEDEIISDSKEKQGKYDNEEEEGYVDKESQTGENLARGGSAIGAKRSAERASTSTFPTCATDGKSLLGFSRVDEVE